MTKKAEASSHGHVCPGGQLWGATGALCSLWAGWGFWRACLWVYPVHCRCASCFLPREHPDEREIQQSHLVVSALLSEEANLWHKCFLEPVCDKVQSPSSCVEKLLLEQWLLENSNLLFRGNLKWIPNSEYEREKQSSVGGMGNEQKHWISDFEGSFEIIQNKS